MALQIRLELKTRENGFINTSDEKLQIRHAETRKTWIPIKRLLYINTANIERNFTAALKL